MPTGRLTLLETFDAVRQRGGIALVPFLPAGYPDLATTEAGIRALAAGGAGVIEIGFPFSDPIADGPVIQEAFTFALEKKLKVEQTFAMIARVRPAVAVPLVAMVSYSMVYRYGVKRFAADARAAGFDGLILPDLPPPEAQPVCDGVRAAGLDTVLLVAPTTSTERRRQIARLCSGFVYYLSVAGITGERDRLPADLSDHLKQLREMTNCPLCVGFGIHTPQQVAQLMGHADGAIVGTAFVRRMKPLLQDGPEAIAAALRAYAVELLRGLPA